MIFWFKALMKGKFCAFGKLINLLFTFTYQTVGMMNEAKEYILRTSLQLFLQKSFKEVTLKEIVGKTNLSRGAFYHYFNSKEQVFAEVIQHFFMGMMGTDYEQLSQSSLMSFYQGILESYEKNRLAIQKLIPEHADDSLNNNYYLLIFDAMRILPDFKESHLQEQQKELQAWKSRIGTARQNYEIRTDMTDEQVAKLFIYLGDGTHINLIMQGLVNKSKNELKTLWDGLYNTLKV